MKAIRLCCMMALLSAGQVFAQSGTPVVSDSRIKTFVYNENDVYSVLTHYGYQSNVEFGRNETIQTVSVGDRIGWQVVPAGRRLFIKAMEERAHTNMTVVTNRRAYQFDLRSSGRVPLHPSEELVYVVRFFYPEEQGGLPPSPPVFSDQPGVSAAAPTMPVQTAAMASPPPPPPPQESVNVLQPQPMQVSAPVPQANLNFNYTLTGPDTIAPVRIYDDGSATYFTFQGGVDQGVQIFALTPEGGMVPLAASRNQRGELVVQAIAPQFAIQRGAQQVIVYNEPMLSV